MDKKPRLVSITVQCGDLVCVCPFQTCTHEEMDAAKNLVAWCTESGLALGYETEVGSTAIG